MDLTDAIIDYRRFLKRKNYSAHTVKNIINRLKHFVVWLPVNFPQKSRHGQAQSFKFCFSYSAGEKYSRAECLLS